MGTESPLHRAQDMARGRDLPGPPHRDIFPARSSGTGSAQEWADAYRLDSKASLGLTRELKTKGDHARAMLNVNDPSLSPRFPSSLPCIACVHAQGDYENIFLAPNRDTKCSSKHVLS